MLLVSVFINFPSPCVLYSKIFLVVGGQDQIKQTNGTSSSHAYTLILVPRRTTLCDRILEEEGVLGDLTITSYKLEFIPLEDDLLSLEMDNVWRELYLVSACFAYFFLVFGDKILTWA